MDDAFMTVLILLMFVPIAGFVWSLILWGKNTKALRLEIESKVEKQSRPKTLKPLADRKTFSVDELAEYEVVANEMMAKLSSGEITNISPLEFQACRLAFIGVGTEALMQSRHRSLLTCLFCFGLLLFIPTFFFAIVVAVLLAVGKQATFKRATNFELWTRQYLANGNAQSTKPESRSQVSTADELQKLFNLKQQGGLTDSEFELEKKKIISKAS